MLSDIEESQTILKRVFLYEKTDGIRWLRLQVAMLDVEDLVEEAADMESKTIFFLFRQCFCILVFEDPATLREGELELVAVVCGFV